MIPGISHFLKWEWPWEHRLSREAWAYRVVYEATPAFLEVTWGGDSRCVPRSWQGRAIGSQGCTEMQETNSCMGRLCRKTMCSVVCGITWENWKLGGEERMGWRPPAGKQGGRRSISEGRVGLPEPKPDGALGKPCLLPSCWVRLSLLPESPHKCHCFAPSPGYL